MRRIKYGLLLAIVCCTVTITGFGQAITGGLAISGDKDTATLEQLIKMAASRAPDTGKVKLLLQISKRYWFSGESKNLDTSYAYAKDAHELSVSLHDQTGDNDAIFIMCKSLAKANKMPEASDLLSLVYGEAKTRLLLILAERYVNHQPVDKAYLVKASPYMTDALRLSDSLRSDYWRHECLLLFGKYYFEQGDLQKGKNSILEIIADCRRSGDLSAQAHYWSELAHYIPKLDSTYQDQANACAMAYKLYLQAGKKEDALYALRDFAIINITYNKIDSAEEQLKEVYSMFDQLKIPPTAETYFQTGALYINKGDMNKALGYMIKTINLTGKENLFRYAVVYKNMASVYLQLGQPQNGLLYAQKALEAAAKFDNWQEKYIICFYAVKALIELGEPEKALDFTRQFTNVSPPLSSIARASVACCLGMSYDAMGQYVEAERYFRQMIADEDAFQQELKADVFHFSSLGVSEVNHVIGAFYVERKRYREAKPYLIRAIGQTHTYQEAVERSDLELLLFKVDTALGDIRSGMNHYIAHTRINDSVFNIKKSDELQEMLVKYETAQKEQSIRLLQSESDRQHDELKQAGFQRNITLGGIALLLFAGAWAYNALRVNRRKNRLLQRQQGEINEQNSTLQQLVGEKNGLLAVKDLLLKEVHHRVKNNLQIVISLLESQSAHLESDAAHVALLDSRNRVQAISLLHQKLYSSNNVTEVNMEAYVLDLVSYLDNTFNAKRNNIAFKNSIDPIRLDIGQALPVGMILNEAITNALKYAFPNGENGIISVSLKRVEGETIRLRISDNGIGLPAGNQNRATKSLGQTLIKGLSRQLKGRLVIEGSNGVVVAVEFEAVKIQEIGGIVELETESEGITLDEK